MSCKNNISNLQAVQVICGINCILWFVLSLRKSRVVHPVLVILNNERNNVELVWYTFLESVDFGLGNTGLSTLSTVLHEV